MCVGGEVLTWWRKTFSSGVFTRRVVIGSVRDYGVDSN